jgi:hypothetical protein
MKQKLNSARGLSRLRIKQNNQPIVFHVRYLLVTVFNTFILILFILQSSTGNAAETKTTILDFTVHGLADFRVQYRDAQPGELENGLGKFRAGGNGGHLSLNEAALVLQTRLGWDWSGTLSLKYANRQYIPLDLSEAFLAYRPVSTSAWHVGARLGMFFPPISLENTGTAWSSPYTLTSSAINTWVGEELKTFGGEAQVSYHTATGDRVKLFATGFANNDTAGALLSWRGWSLHDYEATLNDKLHLPNAIGIQSHFPFQANLSQPFVEVDGRPGYYVGFSVERPNSYNLRALYYDNRGSPPIHKNGQYSWHTDFWSLGLKADLPWDITLISQGLSGRTRMEDEINGQFAVETRFWAASVLLSKVWDAHRFSIRFDRFGTTENDYLPQDRNNENGYALTANYNLTLAKRHQINVEVNHIGSNRPARLNLGQGSAQEETVWQIAYRLFF